MGAALVVGRRRGRGAGARGSASESRRGGRRRRSGVGAPTPDALSPETARRGRGAARRRGDARAERAGGPRELARGAPRLAREHADISRADGRLEWASARLVIRARDATDAEAEADGRPDAGRAQLRTREGKTARADDGERETRRAANLGGRAEGRSARGGGARCARGALSRPVQTFPAAPHQPSPATSNARRVRTHTQGLSMVRCPTLLRSHFFLLYDWIKPSIQGSQKCGINYMGKQ